MAHHDPLTGLPNRAAFATQFATMLERSAAAGSGFAILCIDLDRFKEVNDLFGHSAGDRVLREVSGMLLPAVKGEFIARLGGDEFAIIVQGDQRQTGGFGRRKRAFRHVGKSGIDGQRVAVGVSVGVAIYPHDGADAATLLGNADAALYRAKAEGRGTIRFFAAEMDQQLREKRSLQHDLRSALERGEFRLFYQPQATTERRSHRLRSARALGASETRDGASGRVHPDRGREQPDHFDRRMGLARGLRRGGIVAAPAADCGEPFAGSIQAGRSAGPGARDSPADRLVAVAAGTGNHRRGADRRLHARPLDPAQAQGAGCPDCHGRLRHRLLVAVVLAVLPVRQDQDRPLLHCQCPVKPSIGGDRARRDRSRARSGGAGRCRGRGDERAARIFWRRNPAAKSRDISSGSRLRSRRSRRWWGGRKQRRLFARWRNSARPTPPAPPSR